MTDRIDRVGIATSLAEEMADKDPDIEHYDVFVEHGDVWVRIFLVEDSPSWPTIDEVVYCLVQCGTEDGRYDWYELEEAETVTY